MADTTISTMRTTLTRRLTQTLMATAIVFACGATSLQAQSVAVMVNGEPITNFDIDQRTKLSALSGQKTTRKDVIEELINEKVKVKEGKKFSVDPGGTEVDTAFNNMAGRMRMTPAQLEQTLAAKGIRTNTFKARIKADMVWNAIVRGRFKQSLQVNDRDVDVALEAAGGDTGASAFEYHLRPLVLIVPRGAGAGVMEARRNEANALRARITSCEEANATFKSMNNATIRATVTKTSADLPPTLRELLDKTPVGHLTPPEVTRQGIEMVALCSREPTKVDTPKKRETREKLFAQKFEARSKSYLAEARSTAMIEYR